MPVTYPYQNIWQQPQQPAQTGAQAAPQYNPYASGSTPSGQGYGNSMYAPAPTQSAQGQSGLNIRQNIGDLSGAFAENLRRQGRNPNVGYGNTKLLQYANQAAPAVLAQFMQNPNMLEHPENAIENVMRTMQQGGNVIYSPEAGRQMANQLLSNYNTVANNPMGGTAIQNFLAAQLGSGGTDTAQALASMMYGGVGGPVGKFLEQNAEQEAGNADFIWRNPDQFWNIPQSPNTYIDILQNAFRRY